MKPTASLPLATGLAALAVGSSVLLSAPEAKALCIDGNNVCTTFDPVSDSTPDVGGFTGTGTGTTAYNNVGVQFTVAGGPLPVTLRNVRVSGTGLPGGFFDLGDFEATGPSPFTDTVSSGNLTTIATGPALDLANYTLSFEIPAGLNLGTSISSSIFFNRNSGLTPVFSSTAFTTTAVPGPLPILGAGAAFGFSRSLRRKIKLAKSA